MTIIPWVDLPPAGFSVPASALRRLRSYVSEFVQADSLFGITGEMWIWKGTVEEHTDTLPEKGPCLTMGLILMNPRRTQLFVGEHPHFEIPVGAVYGISSQEPHGTVLPNGKGCRGGLAGAVIWDTLLSETPPTPAEMRAEVLERLAEWGKTGCRSLKSAG